MSEISEVGMKESNNILSDITVHMKYGKYNSLLQRRELWHELVDRNKSMHIKKFPELKDYINTMYDKYVLTKKVLPSMRSMQFAGKPIELNPSRIFNCAYTPLDDWRVFSEIMFLLLGGTGVGYSVQHHHIEQLPEIKLPSSKKTKRFLIGDSIEGWSDAIKVLMKSYFFGTSKINFVYDDIRAKGELLITSGGKAPGPQPLKDCIYEITKILNTKLNGEKLSDVECHDIVCHIADAVLAGGIRRAALISLFSLDSVEMISCKSGNWWELNPQRGRANNSAVLLRHRITKGDFLNLWKKIEASNAGEPGFYLSNDKDWGCNPCCFSGDTKILTPTGYVEIKNLIGEGELLNKNGEICDSLVWSNGEKEVVELTLSNKKKIKCTRDHVFMNNKGESVIADSLAKQRLMPFYVINEEVSEYTKYGFIQGDGVTSRLNSISHKGLEVNIGEKDDDILELFSVKKEKGKRSYYLNSYNEILKALEFNANCLPDRSLPLSFILWDRKDQLMFFKGMYSANGSVIKNTRITYKTTCKKLAEEMTEILEYFKIDSYITTNKEKETKFSNGNYTCKESYDVNISKYESILSFASQIGFVHTYKKEALRDLILIKSPMVLCVKDNGKEEVFDFSLDDDTHWGVVEGIIAHNCEIALRPNQFCNLVEINASDIESQEDFNNRAEAAAFLGTLQASYTDFHYLRPIWQKNTELDALVGVSMTGIASMKIFQYNIEEAVETVIATNEDIADKIGINRAARLTAVKPAGTTSLTLGTSSGIHAWHNDYYVRRIRVGKNESIYTYLAINHPELVEDEIFRPDSMAVISIPQKAPEGAVTRHESAIDLLERVAEVSTRWIQPGHIDGQNSHNVSATISIKPDEWELVGEWMWNNREIYNGLSVLPYDNGSYKQAPFEDITEEKYNTLIKSLKGVDLSKVVEVADNTNLSGELACAGNSCEII